MEQVFDVAVIGGGINGCGCAADAALRGLSVALCEKDDIASKTSSKSTKLIHGGLRYLEQFDFTLVKKALNERQKLLQLAPHLVHPLSFVLPYQKNLRPLWMLRAGLFIYDHLSFANKLPRSTLVYRKRQPKYFGPLDEQFKKGFIYYDGMADDMRLTLANAMQAKEHGATIMTRTKLIGADVIDQQWRLTLQENSAEPFQISAKAIINTTGPWVNQVSQLLQIPIAQPMSLVKGSHLVIPQLYEGEHAYMLQHQDKRIIFVIPYHGYTMVGTTDVTHSNDLDNTQIDSDEIDYLCKIINHYFNNELLKEDIITTWSGVRPLLAETGKKPSNLSRDYIYSYTKHPAPAVTIYGGKITTYRQLAQQAVNELQDMFPDLVSSRTSTTPLPGATINNMDFSQYQSYACQKYHWLDEKTRKRYLNSYGTRTENLLAGCESIDDLGICFSPSFYQVEVDYLLREEWATNCEDILWRRTKLGLSIDEMAKIALEDYLSRGERII